MLTKLYAIIAKSNSRKAACSKLWQFFQSIIALMTQYSGHLKHCKKALKKLSEVNPKEERSCSECEKTFTLSKDLKRHNLEYHSSIPHPGRSSRTIDAGRASEGIGAISHKWTDIEPLQSHERMQKEEPLSSTEITEAVEAIACLQKHSIPRGMEADEKEHIKENAVKSAGERKSTEEANSRSFGSEETAKTKFLTNFKSRFADDNCCASSYLGQQRKAESNTCSKETSTKSIAPSSLPIKSDIFKTSALEIQRQCSKIRRARSMDSPIETKSRSGPHKIRYDSSEILATEPSIAKESDTNSRIKVTAIAKLRSYRSFDLNTFDAETDPTRNLDYEDVYPSSTLQADKIHLIKTDLSRLSSKSTPTLSQTFAPATDDETHQTNLVDKDAPAPQRAHRLLDEISPRSSYFEFFGSSDDVEGSSEYNSSRPNSTIHNECVNGAVSSALSVVQQALVDCAMVELNSIHLQEGYFRNRTNGGSSSGNIPTDQLHRLSSNGESNSGESRGSGHGHSSNGFNENNEESPGRNREVLGASSLRILDSRRLFACPFFKRNPDKHRRYKSCSGPGWKDIHRLK
jgi:hypothetical protein